MKPFGLCPTGLSQSQLMLASVEVHLSGKRSAGVGPFVPSFRLQKLSIKKILQESAGRGAITLVQISQ